jgi:voltage-gated potassium channel
VTTVGYGDRYPTTPQGRLVAAGRMIGGIALLGIVTASIASWLIDRVRDADEATPAATRADVKILVGRVDELTATITRLEAVIERNHG